MFKDSAIYVEYLTVWGWFKVILPALRLCLNQQPNSKPRCYIFDSTPLALLLARCWALCEGFTVEKLDFQMIDARDEQGVSVHWRVSYKDIREIQRLILSNSDFKFFTSSMDPACYAAAYLAKSPIYSYDFCGPRKYRELYHVLMMTRIACWHQWRFNNSSSSFCLYINQRPWMKELQEYTQSYGVHLCSLGKMQLWRWRWTKYRDKLRKLNFRLLRALVRHKIFDLKAKYGLAECRTYFTTDTMRILTERHGQLNLGNPQYHSDVFFANGQGISLKDIIISFNSADDPIDTIKYKLLSAHGLAAVALTPQSSTVDPSLVPVFHPNQQFSAGVSNHTLLPQMNEEVKALTFSLNEYHNLRSYWKQFFQRYNIKLYTSWVNCGINQIAIADAIAGVGGISSIYQRSYKPNSSPQTTVVADIIFDFSPQVYEIERDSGSLFCYHVATGYLGDYRFELLRSKAAKIRQQLMAHGAKHIIAYFDETTVDDARWMYGHKFLQDNYSFWLNKIIEHKEFAIIFKPKMPNTLRRRLGPIAVILKEAEQTGRCFVFEGGAPLSFFPPAAAALASDIAIQEILTGGTAGLESALAGVKTLLMDLDGWPLSPLHKLGPNVVFKDWPSAWEACVEYFQDPQSRPHFGDWSLMINELDPFCDGRAAERMNAYLKELLEGLRRQEMPSNVMEMVAERYERRWGRDKVHRGLQYNKRKQNEM